MTEYRHRQTDRQADRQLDVQVGMSMQMWHVAHAVMHRRTNSSTTKAADSPIVPTHTDSLTKPPLSPSADAARRRMSLYATSPGTRPNSIGSQKAPARSSARPNTSSSPQAKTARRGGTRLHPYSCERDGSVAEPPLPLRRTRRHTAAGSRASRELLEGGRGSSRENSLLSCCGRCLEDKLSSDAICRMVSTCESTQPRKDVRMAASEKLSTRGPPPGTPPIKATRTSVTVAAAGDASSASPSPYSDSPSLRFLASGEDKNTVSHIRYISRGMPEPMMRDHRSLEDISSSAAPCGWVWGASVGVRAADWRAFCLKRHTSAGTTGWNVMATCRTGRARGTAVMSPKSTGSSSRVAPIRRMAANATNAPTSTVLLTLSSRASLLKAAPPTSTANSTSPIVLGTPASAATVPPASPM
mmetsp:Transcript_26983/g.77483  ORF Transcript_26983/g.77483 Transcript_26983/m.77483 type:complete len:414 (-) Transcript_26983:1909-3150(-)